MDERAPSRKPPSYETEATQARYKHWKETGATTNGKINFHFSDEDEDDYIGDYIPDASHMVLGQSSAMQPIYRFFVVVMPGPDKF